MAAKKKYYVVWSGHEPGIYDNWTECQLQIKGYPNARYKSFKTKEEAVEAFHGGYQPPSYSARKASRAVDPDSPDIVQKSIAVDAACSGNPGRMEYQGVQTSSGLQLFHEKFALGTNNIGEFLAIVHGLALLKKEGKEWPVYSDSTIAMKWVRAGKCRTKLKRSPSTRRLYSVIERAEKWLKNNTYNNDLLKWETAIWGEIPADFGRK
ncbi:MAG: ribonuclease H family protein [Saprospiraceae bacterium]|nr:ribonuclease H family protein [Saprospiraceae bacterium]